MAHIGEVQVGLRFVFEARLGLRRAQGFGASGLRGYAGCYGFWLGMTRIYHISPYRSYSS